MRTAILELLCCGLFCVSANGQVPKTIRSAPSNRPPVVDGVLAPGEWRGATLITFDMQMITLSQGAPASRAATFRVMNSANALYMAFEVPDLDKTMDPAKGEFDLINLVFCRGTKLAANDDRKLLLPGAYIDKHFVEPGKDNDDIQKDGLGMMAHRDGKYTVEWAIPLDSGDPQDIRLKPGDAVTFNLVFADGFRADFKHTQVGGLFVPDSDNAANWGRLVLAKDVKDDGGAVFAGPVWMSKRLKAANACRTKRMQVREAVALPQIPGAEGKVVIAFRYVDLNGKEQPAQAKLFLPATLRAGGGKAPVLYSAGYELDDGSATAYQNMGMVVVTPMNTPVNPIARGPNLDVALLHLARSLPFVDDARVVVSGTSAGGYTTLMLAAETFPLAGAIADVPPVNWGYNAAFFYANKNRVTKAANTALAAPILASVLSIAEQALTFYPTDTEDARWFNSSPVAHLDTITCPVSTFFSTGDILVPIQQVSKRYVQSFDKRLFPAGLTMDQDEVMASRKGRLTLLDALPTESYVCIEMATPNGVQRTPRHGQPAVNAVPVPVVPPFSDARQWSIVIIDEGPPEPQGGHFQHALVLDRRPATQRHHQTPIALAQLTPRKLERLMDRFSNKEWLPSGLRHLDTPESERADVFRGLATYVTASPRHAARFLKLYAQLPVAKQALGRTIRNATAKTVADALRRLE